MQRISQPPSCLECMRVCLAPVGMCACSRVSTVREAGAAVKLLIPSQPMSTAECITSHEPFPLEGNGKAAQFVRLHTTECVFLCSFVSVSVESVVVAPMGVCFSLFVSLCVFVCR